MGTSAAKFNAYTKVEVETASQSRLVIMLFNGAIKRAEEAKRQLEQHSTEGAHNNLVRAQDIIGELRTSLNMQTGKLAKDLDRIYEYLQHLLIQVNINKDPKELTLFVTLTTEMRDTWQQAFDETAQEGKKAATLSANKHGAALLNIQR